MLGLEKWRNKWANLEIQESLVFNFCRKKQQYYKLKMSVYI